MSGLAAKSVLLASSNSGKLIELRHLLQPLGWQVVGVSQVPELAKLVAPFESGETFEANALIKANYYAKFWSGPIISDDSGLEVEFLAGQPGVNSNRWLAGSDDDRNLGLLDQLAAGQAFEESQRRAKFVSVVCWLSAPTAPPKFFRGEVNGSIAHDPSGHAGFGYDPIFIPTGFSQTFAELGLEFKNQLSHRSKAIGLLIEFLKSAR